MAHLTSVANQAVEAAGTMSGDGILRAFHDALFSSRSGPERTISDGTPAGRGRVHHDHVDRRGDRRGEDPLPEPVVVKYDPNLLLPAPAKPPAEVSSTPDGAASALQPAALPVTKPDRRMPAGPAPPIKTTTDTGPLSAFVRKGYRIDPKLLARMAVPPIEDLDQVRAQAYRLAVPDGAPTGTGILAKLSALWQDYISNPPAGPTPYRSRAFQEDFVYAIVNQIYVGATLPEILTSQLTEPIALLGRLSSMSANLEILADGRHIERGGSADDWHKKYGRTDRKRPVF